MIQSYWKAMYYPAGPCCLLDVEWNCIIHYTVDGHFPACLTSFWPLQRHVLGHSQDSREMACQTFGGMAYTLNSLSLLGSLLQTTNLLQSVPRMTSSPPKKKNISSKAASSCNYLAWTTLYYHMSKLTSHSSPSYRITYSIQVWTINCLQTQPTG